VTARTFAVGRRFGTLGDDRLVAVAGTAVMAVAMVTFFLLAGWGGPDLWVPLVVAMVLVAVSVPMIWVVADRPIDGRLRKVLAVALALKLLATVPRYTMNEVAYGGSADAAVYHKAGTQVREHALDGRWTTEGTRLDAYADETRMVGYVTGGLYLVTGASQMAGYLVFSWLCWVGLLCVFAAFRVAYPTARPWVAVSLIFLLPSTLYWPSSIGKDALMVLGIGLLTLGFARLSFAARPLAGALWLALGLAVVGPIRIHLALIVGAGVACSLLARTATAQRSRSATVLRVLLLVALVPALLVGLSRLDDVFGSPNDVGPVSVAAAMEKSARQTSIGGSAFETQPVRSPLDLPVAAVNVIYRPFLWEARSIPALVSALEATVLFGLTVGSARWLWRMGPAVRGNPLAAYAAGFSVAFVIAFSNIGNAGILARQRVQLLPVLMLLVAAALEHRRQAERSASALIERSPDLPTTPRLVLVP
jgi:hypothetical protein